MCVLDRVACGLMRYGDNWVKGLEWDVEHKGSLGEKGLVCGHSLGLARRRAIPIPRSIMNGRAL